MRSVSGTLALVAVGCLVAGCSTTMEEAARLQLNSARIRVSETGTRVTVAGHAVRVSRVSLVSGPAATAFVVVVRNESHTQVSDLPISVGVRTGRGRLVYFNARPGFEYSYFDAHLPVLAPGGALTWIYTTSRRPPPGSKPFAIVGGTPAPLLRAAAALPLIRASAALSGHEHSSSRLAVAVRNLSAIPQYQLPVFAFAKRGDRYVAAGSVTVDQLGGQASTTLHVRLIGTVANAQLEIEALPAVLQ